MNQTTTNFIVAVTALAAVVITPLATFLATRLQVRSAGDLARAQIESAAETTRDQISSASHIAQRQIRAELVSANRQAWIDSLRDTIAEMQSSAALIAMDSEDQFYPKAERIEKSHRIAFLHSRVALLINPTEADHSELLKLLGEITYRALHPGASAGPEFRALQGQITALGQSILKREWERVKAGD